MTGSQPYTSGLVLSGGAMGMSLLMLLVHLEPIAAAAAVTSSAVGTNLAERETAAAAAVTQAVENLKTAQAVLDSLRAAMAAEQHWRQNSSSTSGAAPPCGGAGTAGFTAVDHFTVNGTDWTACEDLAIPGGALVLLSADGSSEWFSKSHEPYIQGNDSAFYLGLGKEVVLAAKTDLLGNTLLTKCQTRNPASQLCEPTWAGVERALPVMRTSGENGVRTFVGSRSASVDATFSGSSYLRVASTPTFISVLVRP